MKKSELRKLIKEEIGNIKNNTQWVPPIERFTITPQQKGEFVKKLKELEIKIGGDEAYHNSPSILAYILSKGKTKDENSMEEYGYDAYSVEKKAWGLARRNLELNN